MIPMLEILMRHWSEDQREHYEERAAILEFDAGMTREDAEREAFQQVVKGAM